MTEHLLLEFKIDKDEPEDGIKELIKIIKPIWNPKTIKIEALSGGFSSKIAKCFDESNPDDEDAITVRIRYFSPSSELEKHRNELEPKAIQHLSKTGHFPKIHAIFANGYCYSYIKGVPVLSRVTEKAHVTEKILKSIAAEMVHIHTSRLEGVDYSHATYLKNIKLLSSLTPFKLEHKKVLSKEAVAKEIDAVEEFLSQFTLPIGLCHGDPHFGNLIWNSEQEKITFVDWEITYIGYTHMDAAHFLMARAIFEPIFASQKYDVVEPENFENKFLNFYFEELCIVQNEEFTVDKFQEFKSLVHKCKMGPTLMFVIITILFPEIVASFSGDGGSEMFFENNLKTYLKLKEEIMGSGKLEVDA